MQAPDTGWVMDLINGVLGIVRVLIPIAITLGVLVFFAGLIRFIANANNPKVRESGKGLMIGGVICLFVMVSVWGLVKALDTFFDIDQGGSGVAPAVEGFPGYN